MRKYLLILLLSALSFVAVGQPGGESLSGYEGPFVMRNPDGSFRMLALDNGVIQDTVYSFLPDDFKINVVSNDGSRFEVALHRNTGGGASSLHAEDCETLVVSDLHGRMDALAAILRGNGVVDADFNWIYGQNRLVFLGDALDRGRDDTAIMWLLYKLVREAFDVGGELRFLFGNHEDMVLRNDLRYVHKAHLEFSEAVGVPYDQLWGEASELGKWLRGKQLVLVQDKNMFVHAGVSVLMVEEGYSLEEMNRLAAAYIGVSTQQRVEIHPENKDIFGSEGPLWYRGLVFDTERYPGIDMPGLVRIMDYYNVRRIFVGHSGVNEVESCYGGRIIAVNVRHHINYEEGRSAGALIVGDKVYSVDYDGNRTLLE